jgi:hypothetical protein
MGVDLSRFDIQEKITKYYYNKIVPQLVIKNKRIKNKCLHGNLNVRENTSFLPKKSEFKPK